MGIENIQHYSFNTLWIIHPHSLRISQGGDKILSPLDNGSSVIVFSVTNHINNPIFKGFLKLQRFFMHQNLLKLFSNSCF